MMSDRTLAVLELVTFVAVAALVAAAGTLIVYLWGVVQAVAILGTTLFALAVGAA